MMPRKSPLDEGALREGSYNTIPNTGVELNACSIKEFLSAAARSDFFNWVFCHAGGNIFANTPVFFSGLLPKMKTDGNFL